MKPITEYIKLCRSCSQEEFAVRHQYSFLMHSALTQGAVHPAEGAAWRHKTFDLLMHEPDRMPTVPSGSPLQKLYQVSELKLPEGENSLLLGRGDACHIQINDRSVSRRHARIDLLEGRYSITDCESSAGTFVNGRRIKAGESVALSTGDSVGLGYLSMLFLTAGEFHRFILDLFGK